MGNRSARELRSYKCSHLSGSLCQGGCSGAGAGGLVQRCPQGGGERSMDLLNEAPAPSGLGAAPGSQRLGAPARTNSPLPSWPCRRAQAGGLLACAACVGSPFQAAPSRLSPRMLWAGGASGLGFQGPGGSLGQKCSEHLLGTEAWVLPLRPPSPQGCGGTSQELAQDGGAPCTYGSSEPQAQALLPGGAHCG